MATPLVEAAAFTSPSRNLLRRSPKMTLPPSTSTPSSSASLPIARPSNPAEEDLLLPSPPAQPVSGRGLLDSDMENAAGLKFENLTPTSSSSSSSLYPSGSSGHMTGPTFNPFEGHIARSVALRDGKSEDDDEDEYHMESEMHSFTSGGGSGETMADSSEASCRTAASRTDVTGAVSDDAETKAFTGDAASSTSSASTTTSSSASTPTPLNKFSYEETLIIIDWDDTLLPSTWLARQRLKLDEDSIVSTEQRKMLEQMSVSARKILEGSLRHGTVVIVTNAEKGWVELSCQKFLPSLYALITTIRILSARSTFEPLGWTTPLEWKIQAFDQVIADHYARRTPEARKNVMSFGDSAHEREAILEVTASLSTCRVKSIKFVERPEIAQLQKEHELLLASLDQVVYHDDRLDLCVQCQ